MRALKAVPALGAAALMLCALSSASAQQRARQRAPIIRVYSTSGGDYINTSTYVEPQIQVSENAYVFAVEMDLDGQIQVLHPDFPGLSVRISAHTNLRLPNFFAGFNQGVPNAGVYSSRSEEHTSELQSLRHLVCRLLLEKKKKKKMNPFLIRFHILHIHHSYLYSHDIFNLSCYQLELNLLMK